MPSEVEPHLRGDARQRRALVAHHARQPGAGKDIDQHQGGDDGERRSDRAARGLQQQHHADDRDHDVRRRRQARPQRDFVVEHQEVHRRRNAERRQDPVGDRDAVARRPFQRRKGGEGQQEGERQMDDARLAVGDHAEIELVGQRRGVPELEQRPGQRDRENVLLFEAGRLAAPGIGFGDHLPPALPAPARVSMLSVIASPPQARKLPKKKGRHAPPPFSDRYIQPFSL